MFLLSFLHHSSSRIITYAHSSFKIRTCIFTRFPRIYQSSLLEIMLWFLICALRSYRHSWITYEQFHHSKYYASLELFNLHLLEIHSWLIATLFQCRSTDYIRAMQANPRNLYDLHLTTCFWQSYFIAEHIIFEIYQNLMYSCIT